jgi:hypothetical protein
MQPENLNLDSYEMFKEADGYINITMLDERMMRTLLEKAMEGTGHSLYATNRTMGDGKVTLTFVTNEKAAVLKEQHLHSCRNSLSGIIPEPLRAIHASITSLGTERDVAPANPDAAINVPRSDCYVDNSGIIPEVHFRTVTVPYEPKDKSE